MKVNLKREHFNNMKTSTFIVMFEYDLFTDATLVSKDYLQIRVQDLILSSVQWIFQGNLFEKLSPRAFDLG